MYVENRFSAQRALISLVVKYLIGENASSNDLEGDANVESDCEGDPPVANGEAPEADEGKEQVRAVLITGSFSAYALVHCSLSPEN